MWYRMYILGPGVVPPMGPEVLRAFRQVYCTNDAWYLCVRQLFRSVRNRLSCANLCNLTLSMVSSWSRLRWWLRSPELGLTFLTFT